MLRIGLVCALMAAVLVASACRGGSGDTPDASDGGGTDAPTDVFLCGPEQTLCSGRCINRAVDPQHCGVCNHLCPWGHACIAGVCASSCLTGLTECGATCADLRTDDDHCGGCDAVCSTNNIRSRCEGGACNGTCYVGFGDCNANMQTDGCETVLSTTANCRACGMRCAAPSHGAAVCSVTGCDFVCDPGFARSGSACVEVSIRPIAPTSLGDVAQRRPTLRWAMASGYDGAVVELCRDRTCSDVIETLTVTGTSARPTTDLPARSAVFWRLRGRRGTATDTTSAPTWLFHVPAVSAASAVDTSFNPHFDVNGDGYDDLVVDAFRASSMGAASVFHGSASGINVTPAVVILHAARESNDDLIANAGDVNGDGFADLIIGAPMASPEGAVNVFLGSASGISTTPAQLLLGGAVGVGFGTTVSSAGDVNGDGYADIVVGSPYVARGGLRSLGAASVFHGSASGFSATPAQVLLGVSMDSFFGLSLASAGDVNGDGYADIVAGSTGEDPHGLHYAGTVRMFHGSASGIAVTPAIVIEGTANEQFLGRSLASAGDVNGDGYADLIVGATGANRGGSTPGSGAAVLFRGSATGIGLKATRFLQGVAAFDGFGFSVASAGDVNGDGYADVIVGAIGADPGGHSGAGAVSVFHGSAQGIDETPALVLEGTATNDAFGYSVSGVGDDNGDGYADIVVGAPRADPGGRSDAGVASVFHGSAAGIGATAAVLEGAEASGNFGILVATHSGLTGSTCGRDRSQSPRAAPAASGASRLRSGESRWPHGRG